MLGRLTRGSLHTNLHGNVRQATVFNRSALQMLNMSTKPTIIYTETDEAPALATYSLLPIVKRMVDPAGIDMKKDQGLFQKLK